MNLHHFKCSNVSSQQDTPVHIQYVDLVEYPLIQIPVVQDHAELLQGPNGNHSSPCSDSIAAGLCRGYKGIVYSKYMSADSIQKQETLTPSTLTTNKNGMKLPLDVTV